MSDSATTAATVAFDMTKVNHNNTKCSSNMENFDMDIDKAITGIGKVAELTSQSFELFTDSISTHSNQINAIEYHNWNTLATKEDVALNIDIIQKQLNEAETRVEILECEKANISDMYNLYDQVYPLRDEIHNLEGRIDRENINIDLSITDLREQLAFTNAELNSLKEQLFKKKENKNKMKNLNLDFGPCGNTVRLSMYGIAIQNMNNEWVSYNPENKEIVNVDILNITDGGKYVYKMPVAISDIAVGDIVIHNRVPMFITHINEDGSFVATDVRAGESKCIIPTKNMFGFNFMTKLVSFNTMFAEAPSADNPFGNMLPFLMVGEGSEIDPMLMFMMMQGQSKDGDNLFSNPLMMYFMMKDSENVDPMMLMMMGAFGNKK